MHSYPVLVCQCMRFPSSINLSYIQNTLQSFKMNCTRYSDMSTARQIKNHVSVITFNYLSDCFELRANFYINSNFFNIFNPFPNHFYKSSQRLALLKLCMLKNMWSWRLVLIPSVFYMYTHKLIKQLIESSCTEY